MMLNFADKAVLGLAAAPLMQEMGITPSQYGLVSSGFFFVFCASAMLGGFMANRIRTKWLLLIMAALWSVAQIPILLSATFAMLFASRVVLGAAEGPAYPVAAHALHKWFSDRDRGVATSLLTVGAPLGVIVASPLLTWLIINHGWRSAFLALAIVGLAWATVWARIGREGPEREETPLPSTALAAAEPKSGPTTKVPYLRIFATGTWLSSLFAGFAVYWTLAVLTSWVPLYLQDALGYSQAAAGSLVIVPWAFFGAAQVAQGFITQAMMRRGVSSRIARGVLGGACTFLAGVAMLLLVAAPAGPLQIILLALAFGLGTPIFPITLTINAEIAPSVQRGGVLGTYVALYTLSAAIAPYFVGRVVEGAADPVSGYNTAFTLNGLLLVFAGIIAAVFIRPQYDAAKIRRAEVMTAGT
ncbi:MFS transporter [Arthrobacter sp. TE12232]